MADVIGWHNRVVGYALTLITDQYPPFRLRLQGAAIAGAESVGEEGDAVAAGPDSTAHPLDR